MKVKALGNLYPMPTGALTLDDQRLVKREFGFLPGDDLNWNDPDHIGAFLYAAMRAADKDASPKAILQAIGRVRTIELTDDDGNPLPDEAEDDGAEPDPTPPATPAEEEPQSGE